MNLLVTATAFAVIFPAELPDKTFLASLVLSTRYSPLPVWLGLSAAFVVQCLIAVTAGGLLALLPRTPVLLGAAVLFAVGSVELLRSTSAAEEEEAAVTARAGPTTGPSWWTRHCCGGSAPRPCAAPARRSARCSPS